MFLVLNADIYELELPFVHGPGDTFFVIFIILVVLLIIV